MDVGFYLGELLMQRGEVKVPGLGNFLQQRMSAFYNETEALFYPPYNKVNFEPQTDTDDTELAGYLAERKGISIASAKYFIEKYIANLRQQAIIADVPLGDMGVFFTERAELSFRPNNGTAGDTELYGYIPVKISRVNSISADMALPPLPKLAPPPPTPEPRPKEIIADQIPSPVAAPIIESVSSESASYDEGFLDVPEEEEEEENRRPLRLIIIALVTFIVLAGGILALYTFAPDTFEKLQFWKNKEAVETVQNTPEEVAATPLIDTVAHTDTAKTALKDSVTIIDTVKTSRFELITGKGFKNLWGANNAVKKYREMGLLNAKLSEDMPGPLIKVSLGTFNTIGESEAMRQKLIAEKKLTPGSYTVEIPKE